MVRYPRQYYNYYDLLPDKSLNGIMRIHAPRKASSKLPQKWNVPHLKYSAISPPMMAPISPSAMLPIQPLLRPRTTTLAAKPAIKPISSHDQMPPGCKTSLIFMWCSFLLHTLFYTYYACVIAYTRKGAVKLDY